MSYNVFGWTLNLTQSLNQLLLPQFRMLLAYKGLYVSYSIKKVGASLEPK